MAAAATLNRAQLHPLVFMSITDTISRHIARGQTTPLVGGLLGQQTRDGTTVEVAFDVLLHPGSDGTPWSVEPEFFEQRVRQQQEVNKEPVQLELVGVWTLSRSDESVEKALRKELPGILPEFLKFNDSPLILAFHADLLADQLRGQPSDGNAVARMPFTVYESVSAEPQPSTMDTDLANTAPVSIPSSFRVIPWEMQTGEAEMIALEFVKNGAGNATRVRTGNIALPATADTPPPTSSQTTSSKGKGKAAAPSAKSSSQQTSGRAAADLYTPEEEEMLSFLNTRSNAMKTLIARLTTIRGYLVAAQEDPASANPEMMRAIKALLSRLPGVEEAKQEQTQGASGAQSAGTGNASVPAPTAAPPANPAISDAMLVELLGTIGRSIRSTRELGGTFAVVDSAKREGRRRDAAGVTGALPPNLEGRYGDMDMMDLT